MRNTAQGRAAFGSAPFARRPQAGCWFSARDEQLLFEPHRRPQHFAERHRTRHAQGLFTQSGKACEPTFKSRPYRGGNANEPTFGKGKGAAYSLGGVPLLASS